MKRSLTKAERLRGRGLVRSVLSSPMRWSVRGCSLRVLPNELAFSRLLVSPGRRYGNAIERNYVKRVGKEVFRNLKPLLRPGFDVAFIFYSGDYTYQDRKNQISDLLSRANLLQLPETRQGLDPES
ncbi:MAG: ribonuclease P protein component [Spirochaetales bacterium]|nr:ribonuclease P protein component [Spirochaetales bacterium]